MNKNFEMKCRMLQNEEEKIKLNINMENQKKKQKCILVYTVDFFQRYGKNKRIFLLSFITI